MAVQRRVPQPDDAGRGLAQAGQVIAGQPAVSVAASDDAPAALEAQELLSNSLFRVYTNSDISDEVMAVLSKE